MKTNKQHEAKSTCSFALSPFRKKKNKNAQAMKTGKKNVKLEHTRDRNTDIHQCWPSLSVTAPFVHSRMRHWTRDYKLASTSNLKIRTRHLGLRSKQERETDGKGPNNRTKFPQRTSCFFRWTRPRRERGCEPVTKKVKNCLQTKSTKQAHCNPPCQRKYWSHISEDDRLI